MYKKLDKSPSWCDDAQALMSKREMLDTLRSRFAAKLDQKSGWGKNELLKIFDETLRELLLDMLEESK